GISRGIPNSEGYVMLSDADLRALKPQEKAYKRSDEKGLYVLVTPTGGRLWRFKYYLSGTEKLLSLGSYPEVPLKRAREKRDDARRLVADGIDPSAERKAAKVASTNTFRAIGDEWIAMQAKTLAEETISIHRSRLETTFYPAFGSRSIDQIEAPDLLAVLR